MFLGKANDMCQTQMCAHTAKLPNVGHGTGPFACTPRMQPWDGRFVRQCARKYETHGATLLQIQLNSNNGYIELKLCAQNATSQRKTTAYIM